jgi:DNA-binding protein YbaB/DNA-binding XRE family transcriptional regulator
VEPDAEGQLGDIQRFARATQAGLARLRVRTESPDGAVLVVLTASGRLERLELRPWALRHGPDRLAFLIAETIRRAHIAAGEQVQTALQPLLGWAGGEPSSTAEPETIVFGELVRTHRRNAGLSQEALAARAGVGVRGLRKIETRQVCSPRPATVRLLADALGLVGSERARFFATTLCGSTSPAVDDAEPAT